MLLSAQRRAPAFGRLDVARIEGPCPSLRATVSSNAATAVGGCPSADVAIEGIATAAKSALARPAFGLIARRIGATRRAAREVSVTESGRLAFAPVSAA